ncbi:DNA-directed RNA polymerase subunit K [Candidatus Pacearchaeota archaeon]|nr:DNA-directed RNA polymerase subunit K [Candidatus Pacearchaeota archaeon]
MSLNKFDIKDYSKYEIARIVGARALQISYNAPILIKISKDDLLSLNFDPIKIAELEFNEGVLPITVKRPIPKRIEHKLKKEREIIKEEDEERAKKEIKTIVKVQLTAAPEMAENVADAERIEEAQGEDEAELIDEMEKEDVELEAEES